MIDLLYILWNPNPIFLSIGEFNLRWYSIFWIIALLSGSHVVNNLYKQKKLPPETFQSLFAYSFVGILAGARLGHCLFYEPEYYLNHPAEMILPIRFYPMAHGSLQVMQVWQAMEVQSAWSYLYGCFAVKTKYTILTFWT